MIKSRKSKIIAFSVPGIDIDTCLAKTEKADEIIIPGMTVEEHCLLTGHTAQVLAETFPYLKENGFFPVGYDSLVALHDIGKISSVFQWNIYSNLPDFPKPDFLTNPHVDTTSLTFRHTSVGQAFMNDEIKNIIAGEIVADHHGIRPNLVNKVTDEVFGGVPYNETRKLLYSRIINEFGHDIPSAESISKEAQLFLTGLTIVSDWISSNCTKTDLKENGYRKLAEKAVQEAGFEQLNIIKGLSFKDIFGFAPRESQSTFCNMIEKPGTYILEAEMGQGKTEAALYAAYKLLEREQATGIYFALPTKLTSVAIHKRVEPFIDKILENKRRTRLIFQNSDLYDYRLCENEENSDWFDTAKRSILYPFAVGTIDQALMSVINVKHEALRAFGLAGKVLIIDELHSYDVYTGSLVRKLIKLVTALNGTVIILSATLQDSIKSKILGEKLCSTPYPLASGLLDGEYISKEISPSAVKTITLEKTDKSKALKDAIDKYYDGQNVLWIENTVEEAQNTYRIFASRIDNINDIGLLHSRFTAIDRQKHEDEWLSYFGKDQKHRKHGAILVGTQVLEQSLDIDADVLFTAVAPIDMLLQRIGRLWRHPSLNQYRRTTSPVCYIITPTLDEVKENINAFGMTKYVYSPYVLYRTLKTLEKINEISIPDDIRHLIDSVYRDEEPENATIAELLQTLKRKKRELEQKADYASSRMVLTESDESAKTRVSDVQSVNVLILKEYDNINHRIVFSDGTEYRLNRVNKKEIARKILSSTVNVSINKTVPAQPMKYLEPLKKFTFISPLENERLRIVTKDEYGNLEGIAPFSQCLSYHSDTGYIREK